MRNYRMLSMAATLLLSVSVFAQLAATKWPKYGVNPQNNHKTTATGPSNPVLLQRYIGVGCTEEATWFGSFMAPQGPLLWSVDAFSSGLVINTTPGNVSPVANGSIIIRIHDTTGSPPPPTGFGFGDPNANPTVFLYNNMAAQAFSAYGRFYLQIFEPSPIADNRFTGAAPLFDFALDTGVNYLQWRAVSPTFAKTKTVPRVSNETAKDVSGILFVRSDGAVFMRYVTDEYTDLATHAYTLADPWGGYFSLPDVFYNTGTPAMTADFKNMYIGGHYGSITALGTLDTAAPTAPWQLFFDESFDRPLVVIASGDLLAPTSLNATTGRQGNVLYWVPKTGNQAQVKNVALNGSIVGGPTYDPATNMAFVVTLGDGVSTLYKINATTLAIVAQRSNLGQLRATPILDSGGNIFLGNEEGYLYSLDANLNTRANYPIYVGAPIYTACSIDDDGILFVPTGSTMSFYQQGTGPNRIITEPAYPVQKKDGKKGK